MYGEQGRKEGGTSGMSQKTLGLHVGFIYFPKRSRFLISGYPHFLMYGKFLKEKNRWIQ